MKKLGIALALYVGLICTVAAQMNSFFPGPGTTHSTAGGFALDFITTGKDFTGGTAAINFGTINYGTYNRIVIAVFGKGSSALGNVSTLVLNSVSGTAISGTLQTNGNSASEIWIVTPSGTSGNLTVTFANIVNVGAFVGIYGLNTTTPTPSTASSTKNVFGTTVSQTYTVPAGGGSMLFASGDNNGVNFTWSGGATTDAQRSDGNSVQNPARTTSTGSLTPLATASASDLLFYAFAAWGP